MMFTRCRKFIIKSLLMFYYVEDQAIFNYRLSRARHIIENTFGILALRWKIFHHPIIAGPQRVEVYTKAAITLHIIVIVPPDHSMGYEGGGLRGQCSTKRSRVLH